MAEDKYPFPKIIYKDLVWRTSQYSLILLFVVMTLLYWEFLIDVAEWPESHRYSEKILNLLISHTIFVGVALIGIFMIVGRRFVRPIQFLRGTLSNFDAEKAADAEGEGLDVEIYHEEIGEWSEINASLNKIEKRVRRERKNYKREKDEVRTIMDSVTNAIIAVDCDLHVLFFNDKVPALFGTTIRPGRESYLTDLIRTPEVLGLFRKVLAEGRVVEDDVEMMIGPMSARRFFSVAVAPLKKRKSGKVYGAVGIIHDISGLKQAEKMRIEFVANASHELRTPLTLVQGYLETLKEDLANGDIRQADEFLQIATRNVKRLQNLVADLLDLSAIESGAAIHCEDLDPVTVTHDVVARLLGSSQSNRVKVTCEVGSVYADSLRLSQVLINLVDNALKYTPSNTTIEILWKPAVDGTWLWVRDHGKGIASEHLPRLFERFYRVDEGRSSAQGGTGLGLSIVKHIMIRHGGEVEVESEEGGGTTFRCFFPQADL